MPEPEDKHQLVRSVLYSPDYKSYLPTTYDYPDGHEEDFLEDESDWKSDEHAAASDVSIYCTATFVCRGKVVRYFVGKVLLAKNILTI